MERYYKPYFLSGIKKYIERSDIIKLYDIKLFVLKCNPENGFITNNTKYIFKYGKTQQQLIDTLNYDREIEKNEYNKKKKLFEIYKNLSNLKESYNNYNFNNLSLNINNNNGNLIMNKINDTNSSSIQKRKK